MQKIIIMFSLLLSLSAFSQVNKSTTPVAPLGDKAKLHFYLGNSEIRYERGNDQSLEAREPMNVALAFEKNRVSSLFEFSQFEEGSGNKTSAIQRRHQEATLWARYQLLKGTFSSVTMSVFGGAGLGVYQDKIKTTLFSNERTDTSKPAWMSGVVVGVQGDLLVLGPVGLSLVLEGRALISGDFDPNPLWSAVGRFGLSLQF